MPGSDPAHNTVEVYQQAYLYQARRVATQANVAGGAIIVDITVPAGTCARIINLSGLNSGTNGARISIIDEDNATFNTVCVVASGAATSSSLGRVGASLSTSTTGMGTATEQLLGPGSKISIFQDGAGAQNDTHTVAVVMLMSTNSEPTWSVARSTNAANVTLAASTISAANTMTLCNV